MFEKEAEEYRLNLVSELRDKIQKGYNCKELVDIEMAFQKGAEFGYKKGQSDQLVHKQYQLNQLRKANEWHYVKDGDLPTDRTEKKYLVALKSEYSGFFYETDIWCESLHCFASNNPTKVYAWKEIVLPKEVE